MEELQPNTGPGTDQEKIEQDKAAFMSGVNDKTSEIMSAMSEKKISSNVQSKLLEKLKEVLAAQGITPGDPAAEPKVEKFLASLPQEIIDALDGNTPEDESKLKSFLGEYLQGIENAAASFQSEAPTTDAPVLPIQ